MMRNTRAHAGMRGTAMLLALAAGSCAMTLGEAQRKMLENNADLIIQRRQTEISREQVAEAKAALFPQINAVASYAYQSDVAAIQVPAIPPVFRGISMEGPHDKIDMGVEASYPIFTGATRWYSIKSREMARASQESQEQALRQRLSYQLGMLSCAWKLAGQRVAVTQALADQLTEYATQTQNRYGAGVATAARVTEAQARLAQAQADLAGARTTVDSLRLEIAYLVGSPDVNLAPESCVIPADSAALAKAMALSSAETRPEYAAIDRSIEQQALLRKAAGGRYLPAVSGMAGYHYGKPGVNFLGNEFMDYWLAGVQLQWNLFDGRKTGAQRRQIDGAMAALAAQKQKQADAFAKGIEMAKSRLIWARQQRVAAVAALAASDALVQDLKNQVAAGAATSLEYITAMTNRAQTQFMINQADFALSAAYLTLLYSAGATIEF